jgi:hypothetical protein
MRSISRPTSPCSHGRPVRGGAPRLRLRLRDRRGQPGDPREADGGGSLPPSARSRPPERHWAARLAELAGQAKRMSSSITTFVPTTTASSPRSADVTSPRFHHSVDTLLLVVSIVGGLSLLSIAATLIVFSTGQRRTRQDAIAERQRQLVERVLETVDRALVQQTSVKRYLAPPLAADFGGLYGHVLLDVGKGNEAIAGAAAGAVHAVHRVGTRIAAHRWDDCRATNGVATRRITACLVRARTPRQSGRRIIPGATANAGRAVVAADSGRLCRRRTRPRYVRPRA